MDAFFASIEQRDNPQIRGQPVIVAVPASRRGVVCAASYEARRFGIHAAMPSAVAQRICPTGIFISPRMPVYAAESAQIMQILGEVGGALEQTSIDEAYLELSPSCAGAEIESCLRQALPLAQLLKARITAERGLTVSIGIASNKLLAKIASDHQKPNGLTLIPENQKVEFLRPLPVRVLHGVGKVTEQVLRGAGIRTVGDLQAYDGDLQALVGSHAAVLKRFALGEDDRQLLPAQEPKSLGMEATFPADTADRRVLYACLWSQAEEIAARLQEGGLRARTIKVKVRYDDFTTCTRQTTLAEPIALAQDLYWHAALLLGRQKLLGPPLRLLGLTASGLEEGTACQLDLW